jgi:mRNA-degrading endonuclease YafQ of YafQ-DinJ toxin-antitoxin module
MLINYLKSYDRSFEKLDKTIQKKTISVIDGLLKFLDTHQKPKGLGLKKLYKNYWEIRLDIKNRIIFEFSSKIINIAFVGNHNDVRNFLKKGL